jgi:hypothetical protein
MVIDFNILKCRISTCIVSWRLHADLEYQNPKNGSERIVSTSYLSNARSRSKREMVGSINSKKTVLWHEVDSIQMVRVGHYHDGTEE